MQVGTTSACKTSVSRFSHFILFHLFSYPVSMLVVQPAVVFHRQPLTTYHLPLTTYHLTTCLLPGLLPLAACPRLAAFAARASLELATEL